MASLLNFVASSSSPCIPSHLPLTSHSNDSTSSLLKLSDGTECYHAYPFYERIYSKATFSDRYLLNPSLNVVKDVTYVVVVTFLFILFRFLLCGAHRKGFRFRRAAFITLSRSILPVESQKVAKFAECLWFFIWHTLSFIWTAVILWSQIGTEESPLWVRLLLTQMSGRWYWFTPRTEYLAGSIGWPYIFVPVAIQWFYLTEFSFWCSSMIYIFIETPRKDFFVMLMHHIATCILIFFSYIFSLWKIGQVKCCVILLLHDVVDIFLYASKCANYCTFTKLVPQMLFVMLLFTYFIARLVLYPICCVYPILKLSQLSSDTCGIVSSYWQIPGGYLFPAFLITLLLLHFYWFGLILKVAWTVILDLLGFLGDKIIDDIRSEDEDSEGEDKQYTAKKID
ncbi:longevity-assurance protein (LAG1) domain-containing protein [Cardiosporidium cionae]|uniref:Longevity-assurance protein (LAG1) domain-containing protein n=1 Tax=Cardiosporidium cionae TaxID=476202 RepID=A0ABQ7JGL2_9APIC|nr:longevity-assurance protein (LAG1) domain-containing protein [Cardiosporidium cionae]|eukprot:KAF8823019.1 longevity-assurance protein (LAG1) domain-containing protein [Cardiosporidium cionae]